MVVDDQAPFRAAARAVVDRAGGFRWVGDARSGEDALVEAERLRPDLVLMDIHLGAMSGIDATRHVLQDRPGTVVVLCSSHDHTDLPEGARTCGALAYVHKEELSGAALRELWERRGEVWVERLGPA